MTQSFFTGAQYVVLQMKTDEEKSKHGGNLGSAKWFWQSTFSAGCGDWLKAWQNLRKMISQL
jgi:hypothetical protein